MKKDCKARRQGDEYQCGRCGLTWDAKEPEPPECRSVAKIELEKIRQMLAEPVTTRYSYR